MRLWHLLPRQVSQSDNPENLIILKILVQTTARGQSTKSTPNTRVVFGTYIVGGKHLVRPRFVIGVEKMPPTSIYGTKLTPIVRFVTAPEMVMELPNLFLYLHETAPTGLGNGDLYNIAKYFL